MNNIYNPLGTIALSNLEGAGDILHSQIIDSGADDAFDAELLAGVAVEVYLGISGHLDVSLQPWGLPLKSSSRRSGNNFVSMVCDYGC